MTSEAKRQLIDAFDALKAENERLRAAIRAHRDQRGDDRCWLDDVALYMALGEGQPDGTLPPKCEFLKSCGRYWEQRQAPAERENSEASRMTIGQLEREVERLRAELADRDARIAAARETLLLIPGLREAKEA